MVEKADEIDVFECLWDRKSALKCELSTDREILKIDVDSDLHKHFVRTGDKLVGLHDLSFIEQGESFNASAQVIQNMLTRLKDMPVCPFGDEFYLYFLRMRSWWATEEERKKTRESIIIKLKCNNNISKELMKFDDVKAIKLEKFFYREERSLEEYREGRMLGEIEKYLPEVNKGIKKVLDQNDRKSRHKRRIRSVEEGIISAKITVTNFKAFEIDEEEFANMASDLKCQFLLGDDVEVLDGKTYYIAKLVSFSETCPYYATIKWSSTGLQEEIYLHPKVIRVLEKKRKRS